MTDLKPILEDEPTLVERQLLLSAGLDAPPSGGKLRTLVAFGIGAGAATTSASATAATSGLGAAMIAKWLAVGVASGVLATGAVELATHAIEPPPQPPAAQAPPVIVSPPRVSALPGGDPRHDLAKPDQPNAVAKARARNEASRQVSKESASSETLSAEVLALDRAREALFSGNAAAALRLLDVHSRTFKAPSLSPEATVLRVEALLRIGRSSEAERVGNNLLATHRGTAHAQRVRSLLGTHSANPQKSDPIE